MEEYATGDFCHTKRKRKKSLFRAVSRAAKSTRLLERHVHDVVRVYEREFSIGKHSLALRSKLLGHTPSTRVAWVHEVKAHVTKSIAHKHKLARTRRGEEKKSEGDRNSRRFCAMRRPDSWQYCVGRFAGCPPPDHFEKGSGCSFVVS